MKVFLLLLLLSVLLSATITSLVFLFAYTYNSQPSLLVLSKNAGNNLFCTSYVSSSMKIKTMADPEKHGSSMIADSTPKVDVSTVTAAGATTTDSLDKAYFVQNGKSVLEGKNFKPKTTVALINAKVSKNDNKYLNDSGILVQKDGAPFALVLFKALVICRNDDYALEQYGLSVFEALKKSNGKKDTDYAKNLKAWKKEYEERQACEFVKVYTYNADYLPKKKTKIVRDNEADTTEESIKKIDNDPIKMQSVLTSIRSALL